MKEALGVRKEEASTGRRGRAWKEGGTEGRERIRKGKQRRKRMVANIKCKTRQ